MYVLNLTQELNQHTYILYYHTLRFRQPRVLPTYMYYYSFQVYTAQPMVDTRAPPTYMHLHLKLKKLQVSKDNF